MIRGLLILAFGGALVSALCFAVADSRGPMDFNGSDIRISNESRATRPLPWTGGSELTFDLPARIVIRQGATPAITVEGPAALLDHVTLTDAEINLDQEERHWSFWSRHNRNLTINVTAPALDKITLDGFGALELKDWDRQNLTLVIDGAASVKGEGKARNVDLTIDGAASAKLADMTITNLKVSMDGAGSVKAGPTGRADVSISGAGSVKLTRVPASLSENISGLGSVSVPHGTPKPSGDEDKEELSL